MGFTEIYERIKLATNCRTQVELAELLNIRQSSISDAKRRDSVPGDWYMKLFEHFGLNPDWLKYGVGPPLSAHGQRVLSAGGPPGPGEDRGLLRRRLYPVHRGGRL